MKNSMGSAVSEILINKLKTLLLNIEGKFLFLGGGGVRNKLIYPKPFLFYAKLFPSELVLRGRGWGLK